MAAFDFPPTSSIFTLPTGPLKSAALFLITPFPTPKPD
jgi:hypothetical protein